MMTDERQIQMTVGRGLVYVGLGAQAALLLWNALVISFYMSSDDPFVSWWWALPFIALVVAGGLALGPSGRRELGRRELGR